MATYLMIGFSLDLDDLPEAIIEDCVKDNNIFYRQPLIKLLKIGKNHYVLGSLIGEINSLNVIHSQKLDRIESFSETIAKVIISKLPNIGKSTKLIMFDYPG